MHSLDTDSKDRACQLRSKVIFQHPMGFMEAHNPAFARERKKTTTWTDLNPSSSNIRVLVIDTQIDIWNSLNKSNTRENSRDTGANYNDSQWPAFIDRPLFNDRFDDLPRGFLFLHHGLRAATEDSRQSLHGCYDRRENSKQKRSRGTEIGKRQAFLLDA